MPPRPLTLSPQSPPTPTSPRPPPRTPYCIRMNTERRIQASRANGARSRGPVTAVGKETSAQNSTRHGMLAQTAVLEGESRTRFEELLLAVTAESKPRTPAEVALVETMAVARWRQWRVWGIQKAGFDLEMAREEHSAASPPVRAAIVFRKLADSSRVLDLLLRYETAFDGQFSRALSLLIKLRAAPAHSGAGDLVAGEFLPPLTCATVTWEPAPANSEISERTQQDEQNTEQPQQPVAQIAPGGVGLLSPPPPFQAASSPRSPTRVFEGGDPGDHSSTPAVAAGLAAAMSKNSPTSITTTAEPWTPTGSRSSKATGVPRRRSRSPTPRVRRSPARRGYGHCTLASANRPSPSPGTPGTAPGHPGAHPGAGP